MPAQNPRMMKMFEGILAAGDLDSTLRRHIHCKASIAIS
jgi:hypothetical protein